MPIWVNEGGTHYKLNEVWANEGGNHYELREVWSNEGGTLYKIHSGFQPPDTLTWTTESSSNEVTSTNNGYNCTVTRTFPVASSNRVTFTTKEPTKITVNLDNYDSSGIRITSWSFDGDPKQDAFGTHQYSVSVDIETAGEHFLQIYTKGYTVIFSVTAEKL